MFKEITAAEAMKKMQEGKKVMMFDMNTNDGEGRVQLIPMELITRGWHFIVDEDQTEEITGEKVTRKIEGGVTKEENQKAPEGKGKTVNKGMRPLDMGKVKALRDAGWSFAKIADEMGVSHQTIANRLMKEQENQKEKGKDGEEPDM